MGFGCLEYVEREESFRFASSESKLPEGYVVLFALPYCCSDSPSSSGVETVDVPSANMDGLFIQNRDAISDGEAVLIYASCQSHERA
jgi:hypothetical protein